MEKIHPDFEDVAYHAARHGSKVRCIRLTPMNQSTTNREYPATNLTTQLAAEPLEVPFVSPIQHAAGKARHPVGSWNLIPLPR